MVTVPPATPVTIPLDIPTDAIAGLLLLHDPPVTALPNGVELPWHTLNVPVNGAGASTVTAVEATQPATVV